MTDMRKWSLRLVLTASVALSSTACVETIVSTEPPMPSASPPTATSEAANEVDDAVDLTDAERAWCTAHPEAVLSLMFGLTQEEVLPDTLVQWEPILRGHFGGEGQLTEKEDFARQFLPLEDGLASEADLGCQVAYAAR